MSDPTTAHPEQPTHAIVSGAIPQSLEAGTGEDLLKQLAAHPFAEGFDAAHVRELGAFTAVREVTAGSFVMRHNEPADALYLVLEGDIALEVAPPAGAPLILETLHAGAVLGWSWLFEPHRWHFDAHATSDVTALALDGAQLRAFMDRDPVLGRAVAMRIGGTLADRLARARAQLASIQLP